MHSLTLSGIPYWVSHNRVPLTPHKIALSLLCIKLIYPHYSPLPLCPDPVRCTLTGARWRHSSNCHARVLRQHNITTSQTSLSLCLHFQPLFPLCINSIHSLPMLDSLLNLSTLCPCTEPHLWFEGLIIHRTCIVSWEVLLLRKVWRWNRCRIGIFSHAVGDIKNIFYVFFVWVGKSDDLANLI